MKDIKLKKMNIKTFIRDLKKLKLKYGRHATVKDVVKSEVEIFKSK